MSMTDVAIRISKNYASSNPVDIDVLKTVYLEISNKYLSKADRLNFESELEIFNKTVLISLKQVAENRRFVDVSRSRILAYSGEIVISLLMDYILKSNNIKSSSVNMKEWPIVTDDNFEAASFLLDESKNQIDPLIRLVKENDVLCIGGFIGKTLDGLETTYERGGSDKSAATWGFYYHHSLTSFLILKKTVQS